MSALPECPWCGTPFVPAAHPTKCPKCGGERPAYVGVLDGRYVKADEANLKEIECNPGFVPFQSVLPI